MQKMVKVIGLTPYITFVKSPDCGKCDFQEDRHTPLHGDRFSKAKSEYVI